MSFDAFLQGFQFGNTAQGDGAAALEMIEPSSPNETGASLGWSHQMARRISSESTVQLRASW